MLAVKFEEGKILIRQLGVSGKQELSWEDFLKEMAAVFNFNAEDPWTEAYGAENPEEKPKGKEKKQESVATSQQEEETKPEEQIPGQKI